MQEDTERVQVRGQDGFEDLERTQEETADVEGGTESRSYYRLSVGLLGPQEKHHLASKLLVQPLLPARRELLSRQTR